LGFRVPTLVISPWAKPGYIDHTQCEFASMLKLAEANFNLPSLGVRDVNASDMMNSFNFSQTPLSPLIEPANFVGPSSTPTPTATPAPTPTPTIAPTPTKTSPTQPTSPLPTPSPPSPPSFNLSIIIAVAIAVIAIVIIVLAVMAYLSKRSSRAMGT